MCLTGNSEWKGSPTAALATASLSEGVPRDQSLRDLCAEARDGLRAGDHLDKDLQVPGADVIGQDDARRTDQVRRAGSRVEQRLIGGHPSVPADEGKNKKAGQALVSSWTNERCLGEM
jgi:hypothetical protein